MNEIFHSNHQESQRPVEIPFLKKLDVETSLEEFITSKSAANPCPEKAVDGGLLIWSISHPTTNPLIEIKYPSTGEVYDAQLPLSYDQEIRHPYSKQELAAQKKSLETPSNVQKVEKTPAELAAMAEAYKKWADAEGHHSKLGKFYWEKYLAIFRLIDEIRARGQDVNKVDSLKDRQNNTDFEPAKIGENGEWINIEDYWKIISEELIESEAASKADINAIVAEAALANPDEVAAKAEDYKRWADAEGHHSKLGKFYWEKYLEFSQKAQNKDTFLPVEESFFHMFAEISKAAESGDWRTVLATGRYGFNLGWYEIDGTRYDNGDLGFFDYTSEFAKDVFPKIYATGEVDLILQNLRDKDRENYEKYAARVWDVSLLVKSIIANSLTIQAIDMANTRESQEVQKKLRVVYDRINARLHFGLEELQNIEKILAKYCGLQNVDLFANLDTFLNKRGIKLYNVQRPESLTKIDEQEENSELAEKESEAEIGLTIDHPFKDTVLLIEDQIGLFFNKIHENGDEPLYVEIHGNIYVFNMNTSDDGKSSTITVEMAKPANPNKPAIEAVVLDAVEHFNEKINLLDNPQSFWQKMMDAFR